MTDEAKNQEKKLYVDEDWKSQVEAEREAARHTGESGQPTEPQPSAEPSPGPQVPLPPASLSFLISSLYLQGVTGLGLMPNPATQKPSVQLEQAKYAIDLLAVLQQKTEGNRTQDESDDLEAALHELRLSFVAVSQQVGANK
jgi:hypothetical protein